MLIRAVIFDMDGLMLDTEPLYRIAWKRASAECGFDLTDEIYRQLVGRSRKDGFKALVKAFGPEFPLQKFQDCVGKNEANIFSTSPISKKPGLDSLLTFLEARKIPKAVATSTERRRALATLKSAGLLERFDAVATGDEVARGKPFPDIFLLAAQRLGVDPAACLVLEDAESGVTAAHQAGMQVYMVPDLVQPSRLIRQLAQGVFPSLTDVLRNLENASISSKCGGNSVPEKVDLYNTSYGNSEIEVYAELRRETYGLDLGQTSWMNAAELAELPRLLKIDSSSNVLEIGCGAGGCALHFAAAIGCRVTGVDANAHGVRAAQHSADTQRLAERARFLELNCGTPLPFSGTSPDETFDAVYSNDAFCHIPNRLQLLRECRRVLKPGGRLVFSDALVVNRALTNEEIAARSSIGYYIFVPRGENERLIQEAGLSFVQAIDTTSQAAEISQRWRDARARRKPVLAQIEGEGNFEGLQKFLGCVHTLTSSHRLARFLYVAAR